MNQDPELQEPKSSSVNADEKEEAARRARKLRLMQGIDQQPDFASLKAQMIELQRLSRSDRTHTRALTDLIHDNPAMLSKLLRLINAAYYASVGGGQITSMHRAVSLMGFHSVGMLAGSLLLFDRLPKGGDGDLLRREFARGQLAAMMAHEFCHSRRHAESIYIATMFQRLGDLLVGLHCAKDLQLIEDQLEAQDLPRGTEQRHQQREALSRQQWGISIEELGVEVAQQWGWPEHVLHNMRSQRCIDPEQELSEDEYARVLNTACNELAESLMSLPRLGDPEAQAEARRVLVMRWIENLQGPLGLNPETLAARVEVQMGSWLELLQALGVPPDAFSSDAGQPPPTKKNTLNPNSSAYRLAMAENLSDALDHLSRLNKRNAPPEQVMEAALQQMMKALDLQRAILCLKDPDSEQLLGKQGEGHKCGVMTGHFVVPLAPPSCLFGLLCAKNADVLITDTSDAVIAQRLPAWFKDKVRAGSFVMLPITEGGRVLGLLYGDQAEANTMQVNERALTLLRLMRDQVLLAIRRGEA